MKGLNKYELQVLKELQETNYQGLPLINLVIKNYTERNQSCEQIANTLYGLHVEGKIQISEITMIATTRYDKLIVAHFEQLHSENAKP
jgi:superfamily I DNA and/or RNA helicase